MLVNGITKCYNADQTGVFYEYLPKRTINARGVTVWVRCGGKDKERATAMLLGDSDGNKYPVFIVLKQRKSTVTTTVQSNINERQGFGPFVWREVTDLMTEISSRLYGNPSAWWNEDISVEFLRFHFGSRLNMADKILLLWDDFSGHFTDKLTSHGTKSQLRKYWVDTLMKQVRAHDNSKPFQLVPPDRSTIVRWVNTAWADLPQSTIITGFRRTKLLLNDSSAVDGSDDEPDDDIDAIARNLGSINLATDIVVDEGMAIFD
ncbi:hypothetical protein DYB26_011339 [Aphanomyces astaci]|uniref:DDE-1 domain-containing protein n=1 Tax=Aphanomyces astaci TaxID=112090 RepID=A0A397FAT0_APHAT|nr:hypothetical protein DYB26_011339 [Aphanomyces astaci]RHZ23965.1 hypothetical protein DYB31_015284 [Aphanomyces astaci]